MAIATECVHSGNSKRAYEGEEFYGAETAETSV